MSPAKPALKNSVKTICQLKSPRGHTQFPIPFRTVLSKLQAGTGENRLPHTAQRPFIDLEKRFDSSLRLSAK
jgi:hypothetical protein